MHVVVVRKSNPERIFADLSEAEWAAYARKYPADEFDVYRTDEDAFAPGPVPTGIEVVDRSAEGGNG